MSALKAKVTQLKREEAELNEWSTRSWRRELALRRYAAAEGTCAVTQPNGSQPPGGNIGGNVVVEDPAQNGSITTKFP